MKQILTKLHVYLCHIMTRDKNHPKFLWSEFLP